MRAICRVFVVCSVSMSVSVFFHQMERYKEGPRGKPPHVFAVGHRAYYEMLGERKPQASGVGRFESDEL